jgi:hypothetical protein
MRVVIDSSEENKLIEKYKQDFHDRTGKWLKINMSKKSEAIATLVDEIDFLVLCKIIFDMNGWSWKDTFVSGRPAEKVFKRGLIDFIAINNGSNYSSIARITGRDHTTIINSVRQFRDKVDTEREYASVVIQTIKYIVENIHLYKDVITLKELKAA